MAEVSDLTKEEIEVTEEENIEPIRIDAPAFNQDNLQKAINEFAEFQKVSLKEFIKLLIPTIDGNKVIFTLTSQQDSMVEGVKIEWQKFLKGYFNDQSIQIKVEINNEASARKKAYTQTEQLEELMQSNENFREFVKLFKLRLKN